MVYGVLAVIMGVFSSHAFADNATVIPHDANVEMHQVLKQKPSSMGMLMMRNDARFPLLLHSINDFKGEYTFYN